MTDALPPILPRRPPPALGRLERVDLRHVWESEPRDFTPWLAKPENIALLGESIGLELEVESTEKGVGPYRADIVCKETATAHLVLVENQVESTDHTHLGQLLTYAAGLEAATIVWVARRFTDEHRAAIDWLNQITGSGFKFFALEIELWRIGDSPVAPKFNVISQPNGWSKTLRESTGAAAGGQPSALGQLHLEFWTQLRDIMEKRGSPVRIGTPSADAWKSTSVGRSDFAIVAANGMRDGYSRVYLELTGPSAKPHFHVIRQQHRQAVESALGPEVAWRELPNHQASQIELRRRSTPTDKATWPELILWFADTIETMNRLFRPIVATLRASDYVPPAAAEDLGSEQGESGLPADL